MATKKQLKQLLKKGLTGKEAAKLVIQDSWEVDSGRDGFLSMDEIQAIQQSLRGKPEAIQEYNRWIEAYRIISYTLKEAEIQALKIQLSLSDIRSLAEGLALAGEIKQMASIMMTQQRYDELKAAQREYKLAQLVSLYDVIKARAYELAAQEPGALEANISDDEEAYSGFEPSKGLISERLIDEKWDEAASWMSQLMTERHISKIWKEDSRGAELFARLETDISSLSDEEMDELLDSAGVYIESLYEAGVPEWIEHVDTFIPYYEGLDIWGSSFGLVAILQEPLYPWLLDERGQLSYEWLLDATTAAVMAPGINKRMADRGESLADIISDGVKRQKDSIRQFLAFEIVVGAISELIGVDMTEGLKRLYWRIEHEVKRYSFYNWPIKDKAPSGLDVPPIHLDKLAPTPSSVQYLRERMALSLGNGWDSQDGAGPQLAKMLEALEYPEDSEEWPEAKAAANE